MDIDVKKETEIFQNELKDGKFKLARSQNSETDYTATKLERDSQAVQEFLETDTFKYIMDME
ncbi:MAG: hypothetical protein LBB78_12230 [Spirochaetaceae bacterium]|jgi:hypothetical protein|nr:hypothetical protein [Spirochaetaceae bacterium]